MKKNAIKYLKEQNAIRTHWATFLIREALSQDRLQGCLFKKKKQNKKNKKKLVPAKLLFAGLSGRGSAKAPRIPGREGGKEQASE